MTSQPIDQHAEEILRETDTYKVPVPIEVVAHRLNLTTEASALGDNVSGMLVVENDRGAIGYNSSHARVRQRFTRGSRNRTLHFASRKRTADPNSSSTRL